MSPDGLRRIVALKLSAEAMGEVLSVFADEIGQAKTRKEANHRAYLKRKERQPDARPPTENTTELHTDSAPEKVSEVAPYEILNSTPTLPSKSPPSLRSGSSTTPEPSVVDLFGVEGKIKIPKAPAAVRQALMEDLRVFGEIWNEGAGKAKIPQIDFIDPGSLREKRALAALRHLRDKYEIEPQEFLAKVWVSPLLRGEVREWSATFDWICNLTNLNKIMENTYAPRPKEKFSGNGSYTNGYHGR